MQIIATTIGYSFVVLVTACEMTAVIPVWCCRFPVTTIGYSLLVLVTACEMTAVIDAPVADHSDNDWIRRHCAQDVDGANRGLLFLRLRHLLLRAPCSESVWNVDHLSVSVLSNVCECVSVRACICLSLCLSVCPSVSDVSMSVCRRVFLSA